MPRRFGYSTGALALGDFRRAVAMLEQTKLYVLEISLLREHEVDPFLGAAPELDLQHFEFVSIHAPSRYPPRDERQLIEKLSGLPKEWPVVLHPDAAHVLDRWSSLGDRLLIENMDKRKPIGRRAVELADIFCVLPEARFCFDIGHAKQVDPTMIEAALILEDFGDRLATVHLSDVDATSKHRRLSQASINSFRKLADRIPDSVPIILEAPLAEGFLAEASLEQEIEKARQALPSVEEFKAQPATAGGGGLYGRW